MKLIFSISVFLSFSALAVEPDIWRPYDGNGLTNVGVLNSHQQGLSCTHFNEAIALRWKRDGGDWTDRNGVDWGTTPFATGAYTLSATPQRVTIDATSLIGAPGFVLRKDRNYPKLAMRESATPPELTVTMPDGSQRVLNPYADSNLSFAILPTTTKAGQCNVWANGHDPEVSLQWSTVMAFDIPTDAVSASLAITVTNANGPGNLQLYALKPPIPEVVMAPPPAADPGIIHYEGFEDRDWVPREGFGQKWTLQWSQDPDPVTGKGMCSYPSCMGLYMANSATDMVPGNDGGTRMVNRGLGRVGGGITGTFSPTRLAHGTTLGDVNLLAKAGAELDEAWMSYQLRLENFTDFAGAEGGKLPGFRGTIDYCAGSSVPANGLCGWSMRMAFRVMADKQNPAWGDAGLMLPYSYPYWGLQAGYYGDEWEYNGLGKVKMGQWACIQQHLKLNTPGVADGVLEVFIDGKRVFSKTDVYLRAVKPEQGYGNWKDTVRYPPAVSGTPTYTDNFGRSFWLDPRPTATGTINPIDPTTNLGIRAVYQTIHNGGTKPVGERPDGKLAQFWYDEVIVSRLRPACPDELVVPLHPSKDSMQAAMADYQAALDSLAGAKAEFEALLAQKSISQADVDGALSRAKARLTAAESAVQQAKDALK